jgi:hypothetical protein
MKNGFYVLLFLLIISGCIKVVDLEVDEVPKQLVVNCLFTENHPFEINVSRLSAYTDISDRNISNASVTLLKNGERIGKLSHVKNGIYTNRSIIAESGNTYSVRVETPGYPVATASDTLPGKVGIKNCTYKLNAGIDYEGDYYHQIAISFTDTDSAAFYAAQIFKIWEKEIYNEKTRAWEKSPVWYPIEFFSFDPVLAAEGITKSDYSTYVIFNDALFKNKQYSLSVNTYYLAPSDRPEVVLETGSESYYQYRKRLLKHDSYSYEDPFKPYSPVPLYSNVNNGLGISPDIKKVLGY